MAEGPLILAAGALLAGALGAASVAARLRLPALVLFLAVGMAVGSDGTGWVQFDNYELARQVGIVALALILFEGGLSADVDGIVRVLGPSLHLAVAGTIITAIVTGLAATLLFGFSPLSGLLLGSIVASTDTAAVFGLLRGSTLRRRLARTLEGEAGFNDPVAVLLVLGFIEWIQSPNYGLVDMLALFGREMFIGIVCGLVIGRFGVTGLQRLRLPSAGLYPVASFAIAALTFGTADTLHGSGFVAVYLAGLALARAELPARQTIAVFHDGLAWVSQLTLFLILGLLVVPSQLILFSREGILVALVLMFLARPLAVVVSTAVDRFSAAERVVLSWAGLRGGVPVVLATFPVTSGIPGSTDFFNIVFFAVLLTTLLQGTTFEEVASTLGLTARKPALPRPFTEYGSPRRLGVEVLEYPVGIGDSIVGRHVRDLGLPRETSLTLIVRDREAVPPSGSSRIRAGDILHLVAREEVASQLHRLLERWRDPSWEAHTAGTWPPVTSPLGSSGSI
jgi:cell volume regulation protein A